MSKSPTTTERFPLVEIDSGSEIRAVTFSANGEELVSADDESIRVWGVEVTKRMGATGIKCLAVSKDGEWIAAGTARDGVVVWDAKTNEKVFVHHVHNEVTGVDFSPDSTRVVASFNHAAAVFHITARKQVLLLDHKDRQSLVAAKYSPHGDRIATATPTSIRVYNSSNGRLLLDIKVNVTPLYNTGLLWCNNHLFVTSDIKIKQIDSSTGSTVAAWAVPGLDGFSSIALPRHGKFIVYSTKHAVMFWDMETHTQLGVIRHGQVIRSIALSPDNRFLAVGGEDGKITIHSLTDLIPLSRLHPTFQEPDIQIGDVALHLWKGDQLRDADVLLSAAIALSRNPNHHVLASRALVRTRRRKWNAALVDAEAAIKAQPSALGYIAKSVALVGRGDKHKGYRACDIAFEHFHSSHVSFFLLVKAIIVFMAGEHDDAISRLDDLIATVPFYPTCYAVQAYMYLLHGNSYMESRDYKGAIQLFECALTRAQWSGRQPLLVVSLISGWKFDDLGVTIQQRLCEAQYAADQMEDAGRSFLKLVDTYDEEVYMSRPVTEWVSDFTRRLLSTPASNDDPTASTSQHDTVPILGATLRSPTLTPFLREWAKATLMTCPWKDALYDAVNFFAPKSIIYQVICERLEATDRLTDAVECFRQMPSELVHGEEAKWIPQFGFRCSSKLDNLGDAAMNTHQYQVAISWYSVALSLDPVIPADLFIKRSKAYMAAGSWQGALNDANAAIMLDPLSPLAHAQKHAALHKAGDYENAIKAFGMIFSNTSALTEAEKSMHLSRYVNPRSTKMAIQKAVQDAIRDSPRVLINTISGRLLNKSEQATAFEFVPAFSKLTSSMTTHIDYARIEHDVTQYYQYAMFSHKWEANEPLFEQVIHIAVYDLEEFPTHEKLQMFCKIARDAGLHWAWSDTVCINKADNFVLQEALVSMFKWYQGSAATLVLLSGVPSPSRRGDLTRSIWNTRAWTFQEYHASKVVRFYNEDWTPYMGLDISNHKESLEILAEMEEATGVSTQALMSLRPGLDDIRRKLSLASKRETTFIEDAAYSLLGIFSISFPVVYGEGDKALGRLLAQLLASSGDTSILAWTGKSGGFNSCLPASITVFSQSPSTHIPLAVTNAETISTPGQSHVSPLDFTMVAHLYDKLNELPVPVFSGKRMRLPCIVFKLGPLQASRVKAERVFHAQTSALGVVEIRTQENLSRLDSLYIVHPWIDFLLDRQAVGGSETMSVNEGSLADRWSMGERTLSIDPSDINSAALQTQQVAQTFARSGLSFDGQKTMRPADARSLRPPSSLSPTNKRMRALQVLTRLRQPFGALLLTPSPSNVAAYRRVAAESLITVQVEMITPTILNKVVESVRVLDVL